MDVPPIHSVVGPSPVAAAAAYARQAHLSPAQAHLVEAKARASETPDERAVHGDPIALAHVSAEAQRQTPVTADKVEPAAPLPHPATSHEPGKGTRIDVYD